MSEIPKYLVLSMPALNNAFAQWKKEREMENRSTVPKFQVGDPVQKAKGYKFPGVVVAAYKTLAGEWRYVVECTAEGAAGVQHIFNGSQLKLQE